MRRLVPTCVLLATVSACFQDPGPPALDDDVAESSNDNATDAESSETRASESESGSESATESSETESSEVDSGEAEADSSEVEADSSESETTEGGIIEGVYEPCGPENTCDGGGTCNSIEIGAFVFDICVPVGCSEDLMCLPPAPEFGLQSPCIEGECVIACDTNDECGPGLVCSENNQCYFNEFWGPCSTPYNCPMGSVCMGPQNAASCVPTCGQSSDCPTINLVNVSECLNGFCEIECSVDSECPAPMFCFNNTVCRYSGANP